MLTQADSIIGTLLLLLVVLLPGIFATRTHMSADDISTDNEMKIAEPSPTCECALCLSSNQIDAAGGSSKSACHLSKGSKRGFWCEVPADCTCAPKPLMGARWSYCGDGFPFMGALLKEVEEAPNDTLQAGTWKYSPTKAICYGTGASPILEYEGEYQQQVASLQMACQRTTEKLRASLKESKAHGVWKQEGLSGVGDLAVSGKGDLFVSLPPSARKQAMEAISKIDEEWEERWEERWRIREEERKRMRSPMLEDYYRRKEEDTPIRSPMLELYDRNEEEGTPIRSPMLEAIYNSRHP